MDAAVESPEARTSGVCKLSLLGGPEPRAGPLAEHGEDPPVYRRARSGMIQSLGGTQISRTTGESDQLVLTGQNQEYRQMVH